MSMGKFVWYDLNSKDTQRGVAFYSEVIGWKAVPWEGDTEGVGDYVMFSVGDKSIGGVMELPEEAREMGLPAHWLAYIGVDDADATVAKAKSLGAEPLMPVEDIPDVGRFGLLRDPQGAVFAIFQPNDSRMDSGQPPMTQPGAFSWHELATDDPKAAFAFYQKLFGWNATGSMDMGPEMGEYQMFGESPDHQYGGVMKRPAQMPMSAWLYYIMVDDLDDAISRARARGGKLVNGPNEVPGGTLVAQLVDDQGVAFGLTANP